MLPSIALVDAVEMIRDGGSLAAVFHGSNGSEYWLLFEINLKTLPSGEWQRTNYLNPVVVERQAGTAIEVSWQHAKVLLNQIRSFLHEKMHHEMLAIMMSVAEAEGEISYEEVSRLRSRSHGSQSSSA